MFGISPDGQHFLYWKDNKFQAYDLDAGTTQDARRTASRASFVDMEFDHPGPKPSYGIAGYTQRRQGGHRRSTATTCGCCRSTARRRRT